MNDNNEKAKPCRARVPSKWSFRVDMPMVREAMEDASGVIVATRTPADVDRLCADLKQAGQEAFVVLDLNAKNNVIDKRMVTLGLLDASLVHPREVFRGAIAGNAAAIICVHNHPSGDPTPSAEDIRITRQLIEAGKIIDIKVLDHVIIGRSINGSAGYLSIRESGIVSFA